MKKILCLAVIICGLAFSAGADSLTGRYVACLSKDLYDQAVTAAVQDDKNAWQYLMKNGCIVTRAGLPITILDFNVFSVSKVRIYLPDGQTLVLWTNLKNIERDKK